MKSSRPPRLARVLLDRVAGDNEPLIGDLLEAWHERSDAWFWRQVLLAAAGRVGFRVRSMSRSAVEELLMAMAMLSLLGFYAVVAASFLNHLMFLNQPEWIATTGRYQGWQWYATVPVFCIAWVIGRMVARLHSGHRIAATFAYGASATAVAFLNLYLFVPNAPLPPSAPYGVSQTAMAVVFLVGLFTQFGSRSPCQSRPLS